MLKVDGALLVTKEEFKEFTDFLESLPEHNEEKYKKDYEEAKERLMSYNRVREEKIKKNNQALTNAIERSKNSTYNYKKSQEESLEKLKELGKVLGSKK